MIKIKNFDNYFITEDGEVINIKTGRVLKQNKNNKGYSQLVLSNKGKASTKCIHRMVFEAYIGSITKGYEINHIDGNKNNNHCDNLEQITHLENVNKAVELGLIKSGDKCDYSKPVLQIDCITNEIVNEFGSARIAEKQTKVHASSISSVCNNKRLTAGGFKWEFKNI